MTDLERILALWRDLEAGRSDFVLATVIAVEGPSYRKPGACMLISADGRRAGTISGGCLEAEVAKRALWLTSSGPCVERYSTADDDGDRPFGSGCGGAVFLLLERSATATGFLRALASAFQRRVPLGVAAIVKGPGLGDRAIASNDSSGLMESRAPNESGNPTLHSLALAVLHGKKSNRKLLTVGDAEIEVWVDYRPARIGLWIYGAGDDASPLVRLGRELGWFVSLADGRSHLATRERFPQADQVQLLHLQDLPQGREQASSLGPFHAGDVAIVMTHSFEQDSRILASLLGGPNPLAYIGVLGPQRRTRELLIEAAHLLNVDPGLTEAQVKTWLNLLHAPTGLDLGAEAPETIALSILAEIQKTLTGSTGMPLREIRAAQ
jgi:xanthine/CO dehydrogenase XdhC/CoxF family maturation factor